MDHHGASDDIQGFFEHLLKRNFIRRLERDDGLFRSFLLAALRHWRTDRYRAATALKRGGGLILVPLDELEALGAAPISEDVSPQEAFDRGEIRYLLNLLRGSHR